MNSAEVLRIVDTIHRDKMIPKEVVFEGIEQAIVTAARKHYGEERAVEVGINRLNGEISASIDAKPLGRDEMDVLGRIAAQTAKQVIIQKIREAERDSQYGEFNEQRSHLVHGVVTRVDHGVATVNLGKVEALLPKSEQIPGENYKVSERVRAIILEVRKVGTRVKVVLSRIHPDLVRRLFEVEIPEVTEGIIEVRSLAREAGYRSKVAVSCYDNNIDCVGACVGVRGSRIKTIVEELGGERIDIIRWNDSLQVLIPNALQPSEVEDVILCPMLGRVIVLVREDQLSLAIGKKGQNVRLASKLVGWDIEVMTREELDEQLDRSVGAFSKIPHMTDELAEMLVSQGFFSFDDLSVIEPDQFQEISNLTAEQCDAIIAVAEAESQREEKEKKPQRASKDRRSGESPPPTAPASSSPPASSNAPASSDAPVSSSAEISTNAPVGESESAPSPASPPVTDPQEPVSSEEPPSEAHE